jgi:cation diffusion facilitator CzcD-associated flavoprotein CzcO/acetyl esterase/lipase
VNESSTATDVDVVVVGAGFSGLYLIYKLRELGLSVRCFEKADDVGGTWFWNRYPGARCDIQTLDYSYSFDPELEKEWQWSEKYATQAEILKYQQFVAEKYDLRKHISFSSCVSSAKWDEKQVLWKINTEQGEELSCRFFIMATGCLSIPKKIDIPGFDAFSGESYLTAEWPHEDIDFSGKKVAVIGTGSSGIQCIPLIAKQASELTVFQRTANFVMPARHGEIPQYKLEEFKDRDTYREKARKSAGGVSTASPCGLAVLASDEEIKARFERAWALGDLVENVMTFDDIGSSELANQYRSDFLREKIKETVNDPELAEILSPTSHPFGTKRPCLHNNYLETFNQAHVQLIDLRKTPLDCITETGIKTSNKTYNFDVIVYATGFDAMTGAINAVDINGVEGESLKEKWKDSPKTYLGLMTSGFPNLFLVTGPGSPSVLSNMMVSIEQHVEWIGECIDYMQSNNFYQIEPTTIAEDAWVKHVADLGDITLYPQVDSFYTGANIPGKPKVFLPYIGGVGTYREVCNEVIEKDYLGFSFSGEEQNQCNDGLIWPMQPDVGLMLRAIANLGLPPLEEMGVDGARAFAQEAGKQQPPGPPVGEVIDDVIEVGDIKLEYRLYRPASDGPHPITVYFHGGGWVIGDHTADDSFCRFLCLNADAIIISVNYRHAPEHRFPAAIDDGFATIKWAAENTVKLGGIENKLAVAGWSAGGNIAAAVCHLARDNHGPSICGQLLITPVVNCDFNTDSYKENGEGYFLTRSLMQWFWDQYTSESDRTDPRVALLQANSFDNLPPAMVVTCEFDPLRDEGIAYAKALESADVPVTLLNCSGHIHTSIGAVGAIPTGDEARAEMARNLQGFFTHPTVESLP